MNATPQRRRLLQAAAWKAMAAKGVKRIQSSDLDLA